MSEKLIEDEPPRLGLQQGLEADKNEPYGRLRSWTRMVSFVVYFVSACTVIVISEIIGCPLYYYDRDLFYAWIARTKQFFGIVCTTVTQWWSPTVIRVTGDKSVRHQLKRTPDGRLETDFPERIVLIANHQIYSDWLYLWWMAYTARMHGFIYIILKESLQYVPILGIGMKLYGFIYMARNWQKDKERMEYRLRKLRNNPNMPMWLLIFPEGTNASDNGRIASAKYAKKIGIDDFRHVLLPRTTGLQFCLEQLGETVEWMYDCTVAYEGVRRGEFGQDVFTLYSMYFQGQPPKSVNMHWRRFRVSEIPYKDPKVFELWLRERWQEKDDLMEYYIVNGCFPEDDEGDEKPAPVMMNGSVEKATGVSTSGPTLTKRVGKRQRTLNVVGGAHEDGVTWLGPIETEVRLKYAYEPLEVYSIVATTALLMRLMMRWYFQIKAFFV